MRALIFVALALPALGAIPSCSNAVQWSPCDLTFDAQPGDSAGADLRAELRSPKKKTLLMPAFRSGSRFVIRFTPTEAGDWDYRLLGGLARLAGQSGKVTAAAKAAPGFIRPVNFHHWMTDNEQPHLWMTSVIDGFLNQPRAEFDRLVEQRAKEKFTHLRVTIPKSADLDEAADRIAMMHAKGLVTDLVVEALPVNATDLVARFSAFNVAWMGIPDFETVAHAKALLKEYGQSLAKLDPYDHPRGSLAQVTSTALTGDQWMGFFTYGTADPNVGAVEHQFYQAPALATNIRSRQDLWNATMNGQYAASGSGAYMTAWYDFMAGNRYWEFEPYFDVQGGRAVALEDVEYVVYLEKPGPVTLTVENHGYDVAWIDPATGQRTKAKDFKGTMFTGEPPTKDHDWVLHLSRESHKAGMLKSYKFISRNPPVQVVETDPAKVPFEITPVDSSISRGTSPFFTVKTKRDARAFKNVLVEWTGEVVIDGEGFRVIGRGTEGTLQVPAEIVSKYPAVLTVRIGILNGAGKAYQLDRVYRLNP